MMPSPRDRALRVAPTTLVDCGCVAIPYLDGSGIEIEYCDFHSARGKKTLEMERLIVELREMSRIYREDPSAYSNLNRAEAFALYRVMLAFEKAQDQGIESQGTGE
jgi:hypothetical protein